MLTVWFGLGDCTVFEMGLLLVQLMCLANSRHCPLAWCRMGQIAHARSLQMDAADKLAACKALATCKDTSTAQLRQQHLVCEHIAFAESLLMQAHARAGALRQAWNTLGSAQGLLEEFGRSAEGQWRQQAAEQVRVCACVGRNAAAMALARLDAWACAAVVCIVHDRSACTDQEARPRTYGFASHVLGTRRALL